MTQKNYPRFIFADPQDTKSKGPFIINTFHPQLIAKVSFAEDGGHYVDPLEVFAYADNETISSVVGQMHTWYTYQRMKTANLSNDFYDRANVIFRKFCDLNFFSNCSLGMVFKPQMGADLGVEIGPNKISVCLSDDDDFTTAYKKLSREYKELFPGGPLWPIE
jgi:hypothetical protein